MSDKSPRSIGIPMLIVVFVSICLFSFSGIALSTARNSYERSVDRVERVKNYAAACNDAEKTLAGLETVPESETTYSFPFGVSMEEVVVTIAPDETGEDYVIKSWAITDSSSWEAPVSLLEGSDGGGSQGGPQGPQAPTEQTSQGGPQAPEG